MLGAVLDRQRLAVDPARDLIPPPTLLGQRIEQSLDQNLQLRIDAGRELDFLGADLPDTQGVRDAVEWPRAGPTLQQRDPEGEVIDFGIDRRVGLMPEGRQLRRRILLGAVRLDDGLDLSGLHEAGDAEVRQYDLVEGVVAQQDILRLQILVDHTDRGMQMLQAREDRPGELAQAARIADACGTAQQLVERAGCQKLEDLDILAVDFAEVVDPYDVRVRRCLDLREHVARHLDAFVIALEHEFLGAALDQICDRLARLHAQFGNDAIAAVEGHGAAACELRGVSDRCRRSRSADRRVDRAAYARGALRPGGNPGGTLRARDGYGDPDRSTGTNIRSGVDAGGALRTLIHTIAPGTVTRLKSAISAEMLSPACVPRASFMRVLTAVLRSAASAPAITRSATASCKPSLHSRKRSNSRTPPSTSLTSSQQLAPPPSELTRRLDGVL